MTWDRYHGRDNLTPQDLILSIYPNGDGKFLRNAREEIVGDREEIIVHTDRATGRVAFDLSEPDGQWTQNIQDGGDIAVAGILACAGIQLEDVEAVVHVPLERDDETGFWVADVAAALADDADETATTEARSGRDSVNGESEGLDDDDGEDTYPCPDCGKEWDTPAQRRSHVNASKDCEWPSDDDAADDTDDAESVTPTERSLRILEDHDGKISQRDLIEATGWEEGKVSGVVTLLIQQDEVTRMPIGENGQTIIVDRDRAADLEPTTDDTPGANGQVDLSQYGPSGVTLTPEVVIEAITGAQSVYHVAKALPIGRDRVEALLSDLGMLEHLKDGTAKVSRQRAESIVKGAVA